MPLSDPQIKLMYYKLVSLTALPLGLLGMTIALHVPPWFGDLLISVSIGICLYSVYTLQGLEGQQKRYEAEQQAQREKELADMWKAFDEKNKKVVK